MKLQPDFKRDFSQDDRRDVRAQLIAYMAEHHIGVPSLQGRIARATGRTPDLVPLKTLQRFLADTHRTNDSVLALCFHFIQQEIPVASAANLAAAACAFFGSQLPPRLGGTPVGRWKGLALAGSAGMTVLKRGEDISSVPASEMTIEPCTRASGFMTFESIINPSRTRAARYIPGFRHVYEGIALQYAPVLCIISRNMATRLPRTYWLQFTEAGFLIGHAAEAIAISEKPSLHVVSDLAPFRFERLAPET